MTPRTLDLDPIFQFMSNCIQFVLSNIHINQLLFITFQHEYKDGSTTEKKKTKKRKKEKDSDAEDETTVPLLEKPEIEDLKEPEAENSDNVEQEGEAAENDEPKK